MNTAGSTDYENLIAILAIGSIVAIMSMLAQILNSAPLILPQAKSNAIQETVSQGDAKGYVRPPQHNHGEIPQGVSEDRKGQQTFTLTSQQVQDVTNRFNQAATLLHAKQYDYAIKALDYVISVVPEMPEAYVNMGFAYLGLNQFDTAISAFERAIKIRPDQANAYYGIAVALEGHKKYEPALGAMRTFIHLAKPDNQHVVKARSAIWEWEALLGRIPGAVEAPPNQIPQITLKPSPHKKATDSHQQSAQ